MFANDNERVRLTIGPSDFMVNLVNLENRNYRIDVVGWGNAKPTAAARLVQAWFKKEGYTVNDISTLTRDGDEVAAILLPNVPDPKSLVSQLNNIKEAVEDQHIKMLSNANEYPAYTQGEEAAAYRSFSAKFVQDHQLKDFFNDTNSGATKSSTFPQNQAAPKKVAASKPSSKATAKKMSVARSASAKSRAAEAVIYAGIKEFFKSKNVQFTGANDGEDSRLALDIFNKIEENGTNPRGQNLAALIVAVVENDSHTPPLAENKVLQTSEEKLALATIIERHLEQNKQRESEGRS